MVSLSGLALNKGVAAHHKSLPQFEADSDDENDTQHCPTFIGYLKLFVAKFGTTANGIHYICQPHNCPVSMWRKIYNKVNDAVEYCSGMGEKLKATELNNKSNPGMMHIYLLPTTALKQQQWIQLLPTCSRGKLRFSSKQLKTKPVSSLRVMETPTAMVVNVDMTSHVVMVKLQMGAIIITKNSNPRK